MLGTCHVAIGDNCGRVTVVSHLDVMLREPTLEVDGEVVMERGEPVGW